MFYSQFILAKKGPLGTIWIAAHLERKLRKNQVADTDIGISVDSILFPEVPIALRLSSHLLLGVVRIYSRKVNYLFHDCSEALLKIKQAFRSTAVDLPPEESTAPYHSITLPETFDLDDFELPDSALFHGNFVDHHISTRDQITLQDTMDGMVYSTSQFGLDERFGDGDASQIGLDLDEDLFLDKVPSTGHASVPFGSEEDVDLQTSSQPVVTLSQMDVDGGETSKDMPELFAGACRNQIGSNIEDLRIADEFAELHGDDIQTPDLNDELPHEPIDDPSEDPGVVDVEKRNVTHVPSLELIESAQAPSTPGLREEAIPANVQDASSFLRKTSLDNDAEGLMPEVTGSPHVESEDPVLRKPLSKENLGNPLNVQHFHIGDINHATKYPLNSKGSETDFQPVQNAEIESSQGILQNLPIKKSEDGPCPSGMGAPILSDVPQSLYSPTSVSTEPKLTSSEPECSDRLLAAPDGLLLECGQDWAEISQDRDLANEVQNLTFVDQVHNNVEVLTPLADPMDNPCLQSPVLQTCSSLLSEPSELPSVDGLLIDSAPDLSSREVGSTLEMGREAPDAGRALAEAPGDDCHSDNVTATNLEVPQMLEPMPSEIKVDTQKSNECLDGLASKGVQLETSNCPTSSDFQAPETLLSAPEGISDLPNDLEVQFTAEGVPESGGSLDRFESISGKKRHSAENVPILQNGDSAKFSGTLQSKRHVDHVPDDDDVLASILGGRTSVLKMRPTPLPEVASLKRRRLTPRVSASKRKVLLDDTLVLHGDVIRQQLTNPEDIRRIRRKAPCTRLDIWTIKKCLLEDEVFSEPLFTGMSPELTGLWNQTYSLTETVVAHIDPKHSTFEVSKDVTSVEGIDKSVSVIPEKNYGETKEATAESVVQIENQLVELAVISLGCDPQAEAVVPTDMPLLNSSRDGQSQEVSVMEIDTGDDGTIVVGMSIVAAPHSGDVCNVSVDFGIESSSADANNGMAAALMNDGPCLSPDQKSAIYHVDDFGETDNETLYLTKSTVFENDARVFDTTKDNAINTIVVNYEMVLAGDASIARDASILEETKGGFSVDMVLQNFPRECHDGVKEISNGELVLPVNGSVETGTDVLTDSSTLVGSVNPSIPDVFVESDGLRGTYVAINDQAMEGDRGSKLEVVVEDEVVAEKGVNGEDNPSTNVFCTDWPQLASCSSQFNTGMEAVPSNGENLGCQKVNHESPMDMEVPVADNSSVGDSDDFDHILDENDTEFLNADDEPDPVEEEDNVPGAEEDRLFDNSGWSSRTRAVAKYLKSLFDNEAGHGRKVVPVDNLLAGKTRKEASRMFFETLVLKTKDYIHVEQQDPFKNINIQPRIKLMKSEF